MTPTKEQEEIAQQAVGFKGLLAVSAFAGTGKTALAQLLIERMKEDSPADRIVYLVFNKPMQEEAKKRSSFSGKKTLGQLATINTVHAYARANIPERYRKVPEFPRSVNQSQVIKAMVEGGRLEDSKKTTGAERRETTNRNRAIAQLVLDTLALWCRSADSDIRMLHVLTAERAKPDLCKIAGASAEGKSLILDEVRRLWEEMVVGKRPMGHDHYLKYFQLSRPVFPEKNIIVDEAQDLTPVMINLILQQKTLGKTVVALGDRHQSINGWNGADNSIWARADATRRLTASHRVGPDVANFCDSILQNYLGEDTSMVGLAGTRLGSVDKSRQYTVLSRTNAGVIRSAKQALADGRKVFIQGLKKKVGKAKAKDQGCGEQDPVLRKAALIWEDFDLILDVYLLYPGRPELRRWISNPELAKYESFSEFRK
jgi:hypothetical protein